MKKSFRATLLIFCFALLSFGSKAQKTPKYFVDSLRTQLDQKHPDSKRLEILISLINAYNDLDGKEGLRYEKEALDLAAKIQSKNGEAEIKNFVGRIYWREGNFEKAFEYHDAARKIFESLKDDQNVATTWRYIGQDYLIIRDYNKVLQCFEHALAIYKEKKDLRNQ